MNSIMWLCLFWVLQHWIAYLPCNDCILCNVCLLICSCPVCYRWCLCASDQATVYISMVCVSYGGWWLGDWIKVSRISIKASNSEQFVNAVTNTVMALLESLLLRHQEWHHLNKLLWVSIVCYLYCAGYTVVVLHFVFQAFQSKVDEHK